jgi:hypothetical protein
MKSGTSLLVGIFVWAGLWAVQSAGAEDWADASASDWPVAVSSGLGLLLSANLWAPGILSRAPGKRWRVGSNLPAAHRLCGPIEPPSTDTEQVDENPFGGDDMASVSTESSPPAPEWRLNQPDALGCESHMNSKTRPPP